jgi:DNA-directed RNA polymerase specialized sigma24 family protein
MDDLSVQETASLLGVTPGAVKRYTADGVARLSAALGGSDDVPAAPDEHIWVEEVHGER